jgi:hypothetical protein
MASWLGIGVMLVSAGAPAIVWQAAPAIEYRDGVTGFSYPLRLIESRTTRNLAGSGNVTYYLQFDFPAAAEEPLDKVVVTLEEGRRDPTFAYQLDATRAVVNTATGDWVLPLGEVTQDAETKALSISFVPAVEPGGRITLALKPTRNPRFEGVYLFGITAFPVGDNVEPMLMGYARFHFYTPDGPIWP